VVLERNSTHEFDPLLDRQLFRDRLRSLSDGRRSFEDLRVEAVDHHDGHLFGCRLGEGFVEVVESREDLVSVREEREGQSDESDETRRDPSDLWDVR